MSSTAAVEQPLNKTTADSVVHENVAPNENEPGKSAGPPGAVVQMSRARFVLVFGSLMCCVMLFALDQLIVSTAIPEIVSQFNSLPEVAWLSNGFFVTLLGFTLMYGQAMSFFPTKYILLFAILIFELGSLVCGVASNMDILIFGRAFAGVGAAGIFSSAFQITAEITTLQERAKFLALFGACFGLASVLGPLVGGALTDHASWRWCFYINLPIGGVAAAAITVFLKATPPLSRPGAPKDERPVWKKIITLDWLGTALSLAFTVVLCMALQYGGNEHPWNSGTVIALLVLIPVFFFSLIAWSAYLGTEKAMLPVEFLKRRAISGAAGTSAFGWSTFMIVVYYLSIQYQAIYGETATKAGVDLLAFVLPNTIGIVMLGRLVSKIGRYKFLICMGPCFLALGSGLLYTVDSTTPIGHPIGFSTFVGIGTAFFLQNVLLAAQVEMRHTPQYIAKAVGIINFFGFIGRIVGLSVGTSVFTNLIPIRLATYAPDLPSYAVEIIRGSVAALREDSIVSPSIRTAVLVGYMSAIHPVYLLGAMTAVCAFFCSLFITNGSVLDSAHGHGAPPQLKKDVEEGDAEEEGTEIVEDGDKGEDVNVQEPETLEPAAFQRAEVEKQ